MKPLALTQLTTAAGRAVAIGLMERMGIALVIFLIFWLAAILVAALAHRLTRLRNLDPDLAGLVARALKLGLVLFGVVTALGTVGIDVSALVAGLGLTGFALGFALKDVVSNTVAGLLVLAYKPLRRGERVSVSGFEGTVVEIDLRYTVLEGDEDRILVPNSTLFTNVIKVKKPSPAPPASGEGPDSASRSDHDQHGGTDS